MYVHSTYMASTLRRRITTTGNSAALVLSQDLLGLMGLSVGDEVELQLVDRTLLVRPIDEAGRAERVRAAMDSVLAGRKSVLRRLAEGAGAAEAPKRKRR
jgi:antitoxin component of MazEF toxin-antitoxin module